MPIRPLFKRAHSGVDTVNRAIEGVQDRFKARWATIDKQAQDEGVYIYFDLVFEDYNWDEDHPGEEPTEEVGGIDAEGKAYQDMASKLSQFGSLDNEGHGSNDALVCKFYIQASKVQEMIDWLDRNQGSEGMVDTSQEYFTATNWQLVPSPGMGESYDWPNWDDYLEENAGTDLEY